MAEGFTVRRVVLVVLLGVSVAVAAAPADPWFVDDDELLDTFGEKLEALAAAGKCLKPGDLRKKTAADFPAKLTLPPPSDKRLDPEDVYDAALPGVFVIGSVIKQVADDGTVEYVDGVAATAWAATADGVLVTNAHVLDGVEKAEFFGAMSHKKEVFPLVDVLAVDKTADVAVVKIEAKGLTPLPLATGHPRVGAWVGVLGHPGDRYFSFTTGHVSRYSRLTNDAGVAERWMAITAEYGSGSSGSPVLDRTGAVVGMAALTETVEAGEEPAKPGEKDKPPAPAGSPLQMVVKLAVPAGELRRVLTGK